MSPKNIFTAASSEDEDAFDAVKPPDSHETIEDTDTNLPPEGWHASEIIEVNRIDNPFEKDSTGKVMELTFCLEATYIDDDGAERQHLVTRILSYAYGEKSNLYKLAKALTNHPPIRSTRVSEQNPKKKITTFHHVMLKNLTCSVEIKHKENQSGDRTYANIVDYRATPEQVEANRERINMYFEKLDETKSPAGNDAA